MLGEGGRAVAWAVLGSGLAIQPPVGKGFLPFARRHLLLGVRLSVLHCGLVTKFLSEGLWGPRTAAQSKPCFPLRTTLGRVMVHTCSLVGRGRIRSSQPALATQ